MTKLSPRNIVTLLVILLSFLAGCQSTNPQAKSIVIKDAKEFPGHLWTDTKLLVSDKTNVIVLVAGGAGSAVVRGVWDDKIAEHFERTDTFPRDMEIAAGEIGNPLWHFVLAAGAYSYGTLAGNEQVHDVSYSLLEALTLNGLLTEGLKLIANDYSPNGESYAWPSGHTSSAMTVATVLNEYYGPLVGIPCFGLTALTAWQRMDTGEHWASDVVFGAALGYVVGKTVASRHKPEIFGMQLTPTINPDSGTPGLALAKFY